MPNDSGLTIAESSRFWSTGRAQQSSLTPHAPVRRLRDRREYWGLKLLVACIFLGSAAISLTGLILIIRWVLNL